ncbi:unnamed protein product [Fraxinus pennsylvanica]|uniref:Uncharacterized protein n=1 Tax=Fraxinus pennsylvanica TaxID=56036 RepID=A0AAD2AEK4_9LAMI|nr:unnamed protein product [Fraxinus pennsylvanica]
MVKNTNSKGKLFKCCGKNYGFWEWVKEGETNGESSSVGITSIDPVATESENNVSCMFETMCWLSHKKDVEINLIIRNGIASAEWDRKEKDRCDLYLFVK